MYKKQKIQQEYLAQKQASGQVQVKKQEEVGANIMHFKSLDNPEANFFGRVSESSIKNI